MGSNDEIIVAATIILLQGQISAIFKEAIDEETTDEEITDNEKTDEEATIEHMSRPS